MSGAKKNTSKTQFGEDNVPVDLHEQMYISAKTLGLLQKETRHSITHAIRCEQL